MKKYRVLAYSCVIAVAITVVYTEIGSGSHTPNPFTWENSIVNTYHNLSAVVQYMEAETYNMAFSLNDYNEVCVYCHTPHGANKVIQAPLWNRTIKDRDFTPYGGPTMDRVPPNRPGWATLVCLSCHDGAFTFPYYIIRGTPLDSIINMPGSSRYLESQETSVNSAFLDKWADEWGGHRWGGSGSPRFSMVICLVCHSSSGLGVYPDFYPYIIGEDLSNDHPVGMQYANLPGNTADPKFNQPDKQDTAKGIWWFDEDGDNHADDGEIKLWGGGGATVECATCHNPHGTLRADKSIIRPFLRKENDTSQLCLTCHIK